MRQLFSCQASPDFGVFHADSKRNKSKKRPTPRSAPSLDERGFSLRQPTVLLFGANRELGLYRAEVLERAGYEVIMPITTSDATLAVREGGFDAVVLSYTLPSETVKQLAALTRQECPECPLITISADAYDDPHVEPDAIVHSELGPKGLVATLQTILQPRLQ